MKDSNNELQLITFKLGENVYAVNVKHVNEVISLKKLVRVPRMPAHIEGIMNLRGKIVTLINLASFLGVAYDAASNNKRKVLIFSLSNHKDVGFIVDNVLGVLRIKSSDIEKLMPASDSVIEGVIKTNDGQIYIVLNFPQLIHELNLSNEEG